MAAFDAASDAVLAAPAMQRTVDTLGRRCRLALGLRVGISTGDRVRSRLASARGVRARREQDALDEALAAQIVRPGDRFDEYIFTHALFRHTLWAEWSPSRRVRLHRAIAEQLEKRGNHEPSADQALAIARHFHLSKELPGAGRGVPYAIAAAHDAARRFAAGEEHDAVVLALALLVPDDERAIDLIEANLHAKILQPDFCDPDSDGRWTAALLCALTGRADEARSWFDRAANASRPTSEPPPLSSRCAIRPTEAPPE
jgi:hypothetical protein